MRSPTSGQIAAWVALLIATLWLSLRGWGSFQVGVFQDDANYVVLAESIATGSKYGMINEPGPPGPTKYGFTFPLLLAPIVHLWPRALETAVVVPLAATLINVSLLFWGWGLLSPGTSRWWGLGVASLHALSPLVMGHTRTVMSEPVFTMFSLASLVLTEATVRRNGRFPVAAGLGVTLTLAFFCRPIGIALWIATLARLLLAGRLRAIGGVAAGSIAILALVLALTPIELSDLPPRAYVAELRAGRRSFRMPGRRPTGGFVEQSQDVASGYFFQDIRGAIIPVGGGQRELDMAQRLGVPLAPSIFSGTITALVALGACIGFASSMIAPTVLGFQALYMGALLLWPWSSPRFLYPVQPLLLLELLLGIAWVADRVVRSRPTPNARFGAGAYAVAAAWLALIVPSFGKGLRVEDSRQVVRDLTVGPDWLAANTPADAVVMARYPEAMYLYSGRKTVTQYHPSDGQTVEEMLRDKKVDYVLIGPVLEWSPTRELGVADTMLLDICGKLAASGHLEKVYESAPQDRIVIFRVHRS